MNQKYNLIEVEALLFVKLENHICLIDTGSPFSYFKNGEEVIDEIKYNNTLFQEIIDKRIDELSLLINNDFKVTGLIGLDIILKTGLTIFKKEGYVLFKSTSLDTNTKFSFDEKIVNDQKYIVFPNLHITGMTTEGTHPIVLDTGACVSVLRGDLCNHAQYAYRREYYYPSLGKELSSDFMFFTLEAETIINVTAASNRNVEIDSQFDFIGVDGELCFHDFKYDSLSIDISKMELCWK